MRRLSRALGRTERFWDNLMGCRTDRSSRSPFFQTAVEQLEDRALPAGTSAFAIGAGIGVAPEVRVFDADGVEVRSFLAFDPSFTGGVRTALADLNKDGISDIVAAAGPGGGPHVRVFDGASGGELASFFAYDPTFRGGLNIAAGPIGNGEVGIATGAEEGGGPHVRVFTAAGEERASFYAYDAKFTGGVRVALGQRSDGSATVFTGAGAGGGPHVRGFDVGSGEIVLNQMAYDSAFRGGVNVSAGDWNGDGVADLVTGAGAGGAPHVEVIDGAGGQMLRSFYAGMADDRSGVTASLIARPNGMAIASLMDPDGTPWVRLLAPRSGDDVLTEVASFGPYPGLGRYPSLGISPVNGMGASDSQLFGTAAYLSGINFPEVGIEALDPTAAEAETPPGSSTGLFRVSRSGDAILPLTAYLRIDGTVTPLAKNGDDYAQLPLVSTTYFSGGTSFTENLHKVTFAAHEKRAMIWIAPTNDKIDNEGAEIVRLTVVDTDNNYRATTTQYRTADVTIADNDPFPIPVQSVFFGDGDLVAQQSSNVGMFVLKRTMADSTLTVNFSVTSTTSGYTLGGGYGGSTSATFLLGVSELSFNLTLDPLASPHGAVTVALTPSANYTITGASSNTVEIYKLDGPGPWINLFRSVDVPGNLLAESGGKGQFVVSRYFGYPTGQPPASIPTPPPFPDFALGGTARAGLDYTATKQATTTILPPLGSSMVYVDGYEVEITSLADTLYENGGEYVDFALLPNGQSTAPIRDGVDGKQTHISYLIGDTPAPKPQISIVAPDPTATEVLASTGLYRLMRNDVNLPQSLTVSYAFDPSVAKSATFGTDYSVVSSVGSLSSSGTITFPAGQRFIEAKLTPVLDNDPETEEIARLKLVANTTYTIDPAASYADVTILDKPPALPFELNVTQTCDCGCATCPQVKPVELISIADVKKSKFPEGNTTSTLSLTRAF